MLKTPYISPRSILIANEVLTKDNQPLLKPEDYTCRESGVSINNTHYMRVLCEMSESINLFHYGENIGYLPENSPFGVCDKPEQFLSKYKTNLENDSRNLFIVFEHIDKASQPASGGWRWHKWGPYIGTGKPKCEYLYDEEGFDNGVYLYCVYKVLH